MFNWIHLSDIHFQESEGYNINLAKDDLKEYLKEKVGKCNTIFITGDFRFAKNSKGDVNAVCNYVLELKEVLQAENVFCVPGNHDLDRSPMRKAIIEGVCKEYDPDKGGEFDSEMLEHLKSGFTFFQEIKNRLNNNEENPQNIHNLVKLPKCNILLLNTAIMAGKDEERGSLLLGSKYVKKVLEDADPKNPTIAIGHHGMSFLDREEQKVLFDLLKREKVRLYLCGHEHALFDEYVGKEILQITSGCLKNEEFNKVSIGFSSGELTNNFETKIETHQWIEESKVWNRIKELDSISLTPKGSKSSRNKAKSDIDTRKIDYSKMEDKRYQFTLNGHSLIGPRGKDGIKYYWQKGDDRVESLTFNRRLYEAVKDEQRAIEDNSISAYTVSTSFGCILAASMLQCRFCETGSRQFKGLLSAEEIAMQSIFMINYDANCPSYPELKNHKREISFMGQGEPGYNYTAIRRAIQINDIAAKAINQQIHRYNISTSGISTFMPAFIDDLNKGLFGNKVSLHFSLHAIDDDRNRLMPINTQFDYTDFLKWSKKYYDVTKEKIGIGLLIFENFKPVLRMGEGGFKPYTLSEEKLKRILGKLDADIFKIDLCDLNKTTVIDGWKNVKNEIADHLFEVSSSLGFETKTFSSFGSRQSSGCGMLRSEYTDVDEDGEKTLEQYKDSLRLLNYAITELDGK